MTSDNITASVSVHVRPRSGLLAHTGDAGAEGRLSEGTPVQGIKRPATWSQQIAESAGSENTLSNLKRTLWAFVKR